MSGPILRALDRHSLRVQLISVISLLSADVPDLNSPANVDAAKEVRENFPCESFRAGVSPCSC